MCKRERDYSASCDSIMPGHACVTLCSRGAPSIGLSLNYIFLQRVKKVKEKPENSCLQMTLLRPEIHCSLSAAASSVERCICPMLALLRDTHSTVIDKSGQLFSFFAALTDLLRDGLSFD